MRTPSTPSQPDLIGKWQPHFGGMASTSTKPTQRLRATASASGLRQAKSQRKSIDGRECVEHNYLPQAGGDWSKWRVRQILIPADCAVQSVWCSPAETLAVLRTLAADKRAVEKQPAASLVDLALMIDEGGDRSAAKSVLETAAKCFASNFWVLFELGNLSDSSGSSPDAEAAALCFAKAIVLKPGSLAAHLGLGKALADQGKMDEATAVFLKAERLKKESNVTLTHLSQIEQAAATVESGKAREADDRFHQNDSGQLTTTREELTAILSPTPTSTPSCASDRCRVL